MVPLVSSVTILMYLPLLLLLFGPKLYVSTEYRIYLTGQFCGVYAFGYNSAESEPIWMKSGAL